MEFSSPIKIGISACLAGDKVRFDKGHKRSNFCMDEFANHVEYVRFCPEVAVGLPIPRPTIRQVRVGDTIKVCRPDGSNDVAPQLTEYGKTVALQQAQELSGFVFCAKSPSCGMERVKIYNEEGTGNTSEGIGIFAQQIMKHNPLLPCEENGRLNDMHLRENFVMRVYVFKSWQELNCNSEIGLHELTSFHAKHKYLLMSHNYQAYKDLGRLLADGKSQSLDELKSQYIHGLMKALSKPASRKNQANTLAHLQGYFKNELTSVEKQELCKAIDEYRTGIVPLYVPLTLLKHHLTVHPKDYLEQQVYFDPYPNELRLRFGI
ncbi:YbgA family protein (plasmid) [Pseudoalteromonas sp. T1lg65]|uniref:YbgA family protein n=1 Tax=Pseudoalteromonas sp. T1lg65 TaxID=2077101 RepID=UPI003F78C67E